MSSRNPIYNNKDKKTKGRTRGRKKRKDRRGHRPTTDTQNGQR